MANPTPAVQAADVITSIPPAPRAPYRRPERPPVPAAAASTGLGLRTSKSLAAVQVLPDIFGSGDPGADIRRYQMFVRQFQENPDLVLKQHARLAGEANLRAADEWLRTQSAENIAKYGPSIREAYAEYDARNRLLLEAFRDYAIAAKLTFADDPVELQNEASLRLQGMVYASNLYEQATKMDFLFDTLGMLVPVIGSDSLWEHPENFNTETINRIQEMPAEQRVGVLMSFYDALVAERGSYLDNFPGRDASEAARTNVLAVLADIDSFWGGTSPEATKLLDSVTLALDLIGASASKLAAKAAARANPFSRGSDESIRRRVSRTNSTDLNPPARNEATRQRGGRPKKPKPAAPETPAGTPPRTAQEGQQGASAEGGATTLPGTETGAPVEASGGTAQRVAAGENPEVPLTRAEDDVLEDEVLPVGPTSADIRANKIQGGQRGQRARDQAAVATGVVPEGQRITRDALRSAAETEEANRLANASRDARTPRQGEPFISDSPQLELDLARQGGRIEPTVSGPADDYPGSGLDAVRDYQLRNLPEGPIQGARAGEPVISPSSGAEVRISDPPPVTNTDDLETATAQIGAASLQSKVFAEATSTPTVDVLSSIIPGGEFLSKVSTIIGDKIASILKTSENVAALSLKERVYAQLNQLAAGDYGTISATEKDVARAIASARKSDRRNLQKILEAKRGEEVQLSYRRKSVTSLGDYRYKVAFDVMDMSGIKPKRIGTRTLDVVVGREDVRASKALGTPSINWFGLFGSNKYILRDNPGRSVDFLVENGEIFTHQRAAYTAIFEKAFKEIRSKLTKRESAQLDAAILASIELGRGGYHRLNPERLAAGVVNLADGTPLKLDPKAVQAYNDFIDLTEINSYLLNRMRTRQLKANKVRMMTIKGIGPVFVREIGNRLINRFTLNPSIKPGIRNLAGAQVPGGTSAPRTLQFDTALQMATDKYSPYMIVRLNDKIKDGVNPTTKAERSFQYALVRRDSVKDIGDTAEIFPNTYIPHAPIQSGWRAVRHIKGELDGLEGKVVRSRVVARGRTKEELELYRSNADSPEDIEITPDVNSRWSGDIDPFGTHNIPDDDYVHYTTPDPEFLDPFSAISRSLEIVGKSIPIQSWRELQRARWVSKAKQLGLISNKDANEAQDFEKIVLNSVRDPEAAAYMEKQRDYIRNSLGFRGEEETLQHLVATRMADRLWNDTPRGAPVQYVRSALYSLADSDPVGMIKTLTHHTVLGLFNLSQAFVQRANIVYAATVAPASVPKALPMLNFLQFQRLVDWFPEKGPAIQETLARTAVKLGVFGSKDDYYRFMEVWRATGLQREVLNSADVSEVMSLGKASNWESVKAAARKVGGVGMLAYNNAVLDERRFSFALATVNYLRKIGRDSEKPLRIKDLTKKDWAEIMADTQNLSFNMSRANRTWVQDPIVRMGGQDVKVPLISLPFTFWQVMTKALESVASKSRFITGQTNWYGHASRVLLGQFTFWGATGLGMGGLVSYFYEGIYGEDPKTTAQREPELAQERLSAIRSGTQGLIFRAYFGVESPLSQRLSIAQGLYETYTDFNSGDKSVTSFMLGAHWSWMQEVMPGEMLDTFRALYGVPDPNMETVLGIATEPLEAITSVRSVKNALDMYYTDTHYSRNGSPMYREEGYTTAEILSVAAGLSMTEAMDLPRARMDQRELDTRRSQKATKIYEQVRRILGSPDPTERQKYVHIVNAMLAGESDAEAHQIRQIVINKITTANDPAMQLQLDALSGKYQELGSTAMDAVIVNEAVRQEQ